VSRNKIRTFSAAEIIFKTAEVLKNFNKVYQNGSLFGLPFFMRNTEKIIFSA
jgi:hypothetical protein